MKHEDEIIEIREMLNRCKKDNILQEGFSATLDDEELTEGVTYIHKKDFGLPCDIIVDCGENYQIYNHPLCLYMVENENVYPILVQENPVSVSGKDIPFALRKFIVDNISILKRFADLEISGPDFFDEIRKNQEYALVVEMSVYDKEDTGLPIKVYVDDTNSYQRSGHNGSYRFKFQQDKDIKNPRK